MENVGVIGSGTMGSGIAQVFSQSGYQVVVVDQQKAALDRARGGIEKSLQKLESKGRLESGQAEASLGRLKFATELEALSGCGLVVEAIFEDLEVKGRLWSDLSDKLAEGCIAASNTSSISITRLASSFVAPERFLGMHFMNPVPLMPLVEVIRGQRTSEAALQAVLEACKKLGKTPVAAEDYPGFISNRILMPMINEAVFCLMEGVGRAEAIDSVMKLGMNHPMGPLKLADLIGLDVCLAIMEVLHRELGDKYRPCPLLRKMVDAKLLGRKAGEGFYSYE